VEPSEHLDRVLRLGQKLLKELDPGSDTLQQWMIHYIAGLIEGAVNASGDQKQEAERKCSEAILDLWKNQSEYGQVREQLASVEQIISTISSLRDESPWYFSAARHEEANPYCQKALAVDRAARNLISFFLLLANEHAEDKQKDWLGFARGLPAGASPLPIIKIVIVTDALQELSEADKRADLVQEARKGIAEFRSLIDEIEAAVDAATSKD
jgi:hypothetical protein